MLPHHTAGKFPTSPIGRYIAPREWLRDSLALSARIRKHIRTPKEDIGFFFQQRIQIGEEMKQRTLATMNGLERYTKLQEDGRAVLFDEMKQVVPWAELCGLIEPCLPECWQPAASGRFGADAPHLFSAAVVQSVTPGGGT